MLSKGEDLRGIQIMTTSAPALQPVQYMCTLWFNVLPRGFLPQFVPTSRSDGGSEAEGTPDLETRGYLFPHNFHIHIFQIAEPESVRDLRALKLLIFDMQYGFVDMNDL